MTTSASNEISPCERERERERKRERERERKRGRERKKERVKETNTTIDSNTLSVHTVTCLLYRHLNANKA